MEASLNLHLAQFGFDQGCQKYFYPMQLRNEIGTRGGTVDSMGRENKNKRRKEKK